MAGTEDSCHCIRTKVNWVVGRFRRGKFFARADKTVARIRDGTLAHPKRPYIYFTPTVKPVRNYSPRRLTDGLSEKAVT